jgi:thiamine-monophosphate kinase
MISSETHIPNVMKPWQIGWFVVAINLSDIAAKGGKPLGIVLSLGLPKNTNDLYLGELMQGADKCATQYGTIIIGGDTKENPNLVISGTIIGKVKKEEFMSRKGIQTGDTIAITGSLGKAGAGYFALKKKIKYEKILKDLFEPIPRINEGMALAREKIVTSCMDISDGLSSSLYQLQELNKVGFEIDQDKIPLSSNLLEIYSKNQELDVFEYALHFGGDYELLITTPQSNFEKAKQILNKIGTQITPVGRVTKNSTISLMKNEVKTVLPNRGYEHFKKFMF